MPVVIVRASCAGADDRSRGWSKPYLTRNGFVAAQVKRRRTWAVTSVSMLGQKKCRASAAATRWLVLSLPLCSSETSSPSA
jgi:hypothetical protein